jgi:hypothetical protein
MRPKAAHVIIVGLSEEQRQELDKKTLEILHSSDPSWKYKSDRCDTVDEAFALAAKLKTIDIIYIGDSKETAPAEERMAHVSNLFERFFKGAPDKPVISYAYRDDGAPRYKLPAALFALWRDRNKNARPHA